MQARWEEVSRLVDLALDLETADRPELLDRTCSADPALRGEVERLLAATERAADFLGQPVVADAAPLVSWVERQESQALATGTRFGAYELKGLLGRGGMAAVYLAEDHKHHRTVAVKVFDSEVGAAIGREWFLREIDIAAGLHHPHILPLHDSGELAGRLYYVMPHVRGESLRQRLTREGRIPLASAQRILQEVAGALDYAHRQHVVHRDIKPENILLQEGQAIVADFGIARAIDAGVVEAGIAETIPALGTPAYMSPEQATRTAPIDGRTDVYALGCVLYEMLAGAPPFHGPTVQAVLAQHATDPVPSLRVVRPDVPLALEAALTRALQKSPADRFVTAGEFVEAIERAVNATTSQSKKEWPQRWLAAGLAATAILTMAIVYTLRQPAAAPTPDPGLVAILPFRTAGATPELAWLREGLVDLLSSKLGSEGGLRTAEPTSVLSAWRRLGGADSTTMSADAVLELGRGLGAGRMIEGSVVGTPEHLTITASLLPLPGGTSTAGASTAGPVDSLPVLVNRLAARLLSLAAGVDSTRLTASSSSLPAVRAFLEGRSAFRLGDVGGAFRHFREATMLDSTFALAALELVHASVWVDGAWSKDAMRGKRIAQAHRDQLSPADQALLDAWDVDDITGPESISGWEAASRANPRRAETWYELGDAYFHNGAVVGLDDPITLAAESFERGWALDSANGTDAVAAGRSPVVAEPLTHMVEIAQVQGDTASVRRRVALRLSADSTSRQGWYLRWHRALASDDAARRAFWADSAKVDPGAWGLIDAFMNWTGVGTQDLPRVANMDTRVVEAGHPGDVSSAHALALLNGGRPREARRLLGTDDRSAGSLIDRIYSALYWEGDTTAATDAARRLARGETGVTRGSWSGRQYVRTTCALGEWHASRADYGYAEAAIRKLHAVADTGVPVNDSLPSHRDGAAKQLAILCSALLEATRASALHLADAPSKLVQADRMARTYVFVAPLAANLEIARLAEEQADLGLALRAVRRRDGGYLGGFPWYLSTFLHEEGRLAALTGDTAGAVRAYRHYLALRTNPEAEVKPETEVVRSELARLERAPAQ
jgi:eukaryotic-like serine/threonine-protein kinase